MRMLLRCLLMFLIGLIECRPQAVPSGSTSELSSLATVDDFEIPKCRFLRRRSQLRATAPCG